MSRCFLLAFVQFTPVLVFGSLTRSRQVLPPAFCGQLLEETYGALRGWTPSQPQLLKLCSGLMVRKLRMARTPAAAHEPCKAFAMGISARRAEARGPLPPLAKLKVDWCDAPPASELPRAVQEPRRILLAPPPTPRLPHKQAFVNLDDEDIARGASHSPPKAAAAPLHVMVQNGAKEHHHHHRPRDWEALTDRDALLRARDALLNGGDDSAVMAAAGNAGSSSPSSTSADSSGGPAQKHATALVGAHAKQEGHNQSLMAASLGYLSEGASWAKDKLLSTLDFVCDGHCGIKRKPAQFEVRG